MPRSSALARSLHPQTSQWGVTDYLLALVVDALNGGNWQRGGARGPRPKPLKRPVEGTPANTTHIGADPLPIDELDAWLDATST